jgi:hypothetical protein
MKVEQENKPLMCIGCHLCVCVCVCVCDVCVRVNEVALQNTERLVLTCTNCSRVQADKLAAAKGVQLPNDFVEAALTGGLRKSALEAYLLLQVRLIT